MRCAQALTQDLDPLLLHAHPRPGSAQALLELGVVHACARLQATVPSGCTEPLPLRQTDPGKTMPREHVAATKGALMSDVGNGDRIVLAPPAELDVATADTFRTMLADALRERPARLEVDWTTVTICDSSGMKVLIHAARLAQAVDCQLRVVNPSRPLLRLAEVLGASDLLGLPPAGLSGQFAR
jgi:anti-sigma B factor antagonist